MLHNRFQQVLTEAGIDEAGRGCYAGPVYAAAVVLHPDFHHPLLNDSKQVKEADRNELRKYIEQHAVAYAVCSTDVNTIDSINILQATYRAMHGAIASLTITPQLLLVDGNRFKPYHSIPHECIIKGDASFTAIAAASILAKTYRDEYMMGIDKDFPEYQWKKNKGYGTLVHRNAIAQHGICIHHRKSFNILPNQTTLF